MGFNWDLRYCGDIVLLDFYCDVDRLRIDLGLTSL